MVSAEMIAEARRLGLVTTPEVHARMVARYGQQTLDEVITARGWRRSRAGDHRPGRHYIYDADGVEIGVLDVFECWALVLLIDEAA